MNASELIVNFNSNGTIFPFWCLVCYFVFLFVGFALNLCIGLCLLTRKHKGPFSSVLQLNVVDCLSTFVAVAEIWSISKNSWTFSTPLCLVFSGGEVLTNTFILYSITCLNFHIVSNVNLCLNREQKDQKLQLKSIDDDDSEQFLVDRIDDQNSNRNVTIDYRRKKTNIPIAFPLILIWFLGLSLSVPQFTLSTTVIVQNNSTLCTIFDTFYNKLLQNLSVLFRIVIPVPLLLLSLIILIKKAYQVKRTKNVDQSATLLRKTEKNRTLLVLGMSLTIMYLLFSLQRLIFFLLHVIAQEVDNNRTTDFFKIPPLENVTCSNYTNLLSAMIYYVSSTLRPVMYIFVLPELRHIFDLKKKLKCITNKS